MSSIIPKEELRSFLQKNALFEGLNERQVDLILPLIKVVTFKTNEILIKENETSDNIYIIKSGSVGVFKWDSFSNQFHQLATLSENALFGEMILIDNSPRSATVRALEESTALLISRTNLYTLTTGQVDYKKILEQLTALADSAKKIIDESPIFPLMIQNIAKGLAQRIRSTNDTVVDALRSDLRHAKAQVSLGILVVNVLSVLACYMIVLKTIEQLHHPIMITSLVSIPIIIVFAIATFYIILKSDYPISFYGITLNDWKPAIFEAALMTVVILVASILMKYVAIETMSLYANRSVFDGEIFDNTLSYSTEAMILFAYIIFVPFQELITRGLLQGSFQEFLLGKHKILLSIILSNLLFSVTHLHLATMFAVTVFMTGLLWGWLYSRHQTLIGVLLSHLCVGVWGIFILGI